MAFKWHDGIGNNNNWTASSHLQTVFDASTLARRRPSVTVRLAKPSRALPRNWTLSVCASVTCILSTFPWRYERPQTLCSNLGRWPGRWDWIVSPQGGYLSVTIRDTTTGSPEMNRSSAFFCPPHYLSVLLLLTAGAHLHKLINVRESLRQLKSEKNWSLHLKWLPELTTGVMHALHHWDGSLHRSNQSVITVLVKDNTGLERTTASSTLQQAGIDIIPCVWAARWPLDPRKRTRKEDRAFGDKP